MNRAARTARLSIVSNTALIAMKLVVGLISGSVSIISEAIHSLMDLAAAIMAFFSIRVAQTPADDEHPYGHEKVENVSGVLEAVLIFVAAGLIIVEAVKKLLHQEEVKNLELGIVVMILSGLVNIVVSRLLYKVAAEERSVALEADALHLKTDVYSSLGVGLGLLVIVILERVFHLAWAYYLDPLVAMVIALVILKESWEMLRKAFGPLVDASLSAEDREIIGEIVARQSGRSLHSMRTRKAGGKKHIDFHLTLPSTTSIKEAHALCDSIEGEIEARLVNTSVIIHVEPEEADRP